MRLLRVKITACTAASPLLVLTPDYILYCYYDCQARCIIHVRTSIAANEAVSKNAMQKMNGWAMDGWVGGWHMNHMHEVIKFSWEACACRLIRRQNCSS